MIPSCKGNLRANKKPNDMDFKITKDIHLQLMKGKCSLHAKLITMDQGKLELKTKIMHVFMVSIFIYSQLLGNDDSHDKHNLACFCLLSIFYYGIY